MHEIFTKEELDEAKSFLNGRMREFVSDTSCGHKLRDNAIKTFKEDYSIKSDDINVVRVEADLALKNDISYAIERNIEDERTGKHDIR